MSIVGTTFIPHNLFFFSTSHHQPVFKMARRRKTPATNSLPVQTIIPKSKQTSKKKQKDKMDAAGMKSWAQMLSGEKPALPKTFTDNLGAYAGPSKKNKRNRKGKKGPAAPTPAAQPLVAPTLTVPATVLSTPVVATPTRLTPAVRIPAAPIARIPIVPAIPVVSVVRAQDNSAPAILVQVVVTPPRPTPATPVQAIPTKTIPTARTPALPAAQVQAVLAPVIPAPTTPVRIPTLWELNPAYVS